MSAVSNIDMKIPGIRKEPTAWVKSMCREPNCGKPKHNARLNNSKSGGI
jgi:hypothetical protein